MDFELVQKHLEHNDIKVQALKFIPKVSHQDMRGTVAIFTHGYTSHKGDLVNWAYHLLQLNIPSLIFDLPGHYLGSFNEVDNLEKFNLGVPALFEKALLQLDEYNPVNIILGGHSMGAHYSLLALNQESFHEANTFNICVGLGHKDQDKPTFLESSLYKETLDLRKKLVSKVLFPEYIIPLLKESNEKLQFKNKKIHLISGKNDVIANEKSLEKFKERLWLQGNYVTTETPGNLPHHQPELAAAFIRNHVRKNVLKIS